MRTEYVRVAIEMNDGMIVLMSFVTVNRSLTLPYGAQWINDQLGLWRREATDENIFAEVSKAFPRVDRDGNVLSQPVRHWRVKEEEIPVDRTYRNALRVQGNKLEYDMAQARNLHLDQIRIAREKKFIELDAQWMRAVGQGLTNEALTIELQRQALRDLPQSLGVEQAKNIEELKIMWPRDLPR